ncbi:MAG: hypothetical protein M5U12_07105 [Verrucomicrobia bacterium]|nr:hypothetical protein [Verrucomicrobiota bacterium]
MTVVDRPGNEFLARTALARDQHAGVQAELMQAPDVLHQSLDGGAPADKTLQPPPRRLLLREQGQPLVRGLERRLRLLSLLDLGLQFLVLAAQFLRLPMQCQVRPDPDKHFVGLEGLGDVVDPAGPEALDHGLGLVPRGDEDHRDRARGRDLFQLPAGLEPVQPGHHHVEQDHFRMRLAGDPQRGLPVGCQEHFVALRLQGLPQQVAVVREVVHHQHATR